MQTDEVVETLNAQMDAMAEMVAEGATIQQAGRQIGIDTNRACKVWRHVRQKLGPQAV